MGWWGCELFSGDSPLDWIGHTEKALENLIDTTIKEKYHKTLYTDEEDLPAIIFFYADMMSRYSRRTGKLLKYASWLRERAKTIRENQDWRDPSERSQVLERLADEIEARFCDEKEGYRMDYTKIEKVDIAGTRVYHLTTKEILPKIIEEGLKPQRCFAGWGENRTGIYVAKSFMGAMKWQFNCLGHKLNPEPAIISFAVNERDEVYPDKRVDFKEDFVVCNHISTERLSYFA